MNEGRLSHASVQEQTRVSGWAAVAGALSSSASSDFVIISLLLHQHLHDVIVWLQCIFAGLGELFHSLLEGVLFP